MTCEWKRIFNNKYSISSNGEVKSFVGKEKILKKTKDNRGYFSVSLMINGKRKLVSIHRLVAKAFIENRHNKKCVNHKNGIKTDNDITNIEWCTHYENNKHARETGLNKDVGDNHHAAKITTEVVKRIRKEHKQGKIKQAEIAKKYGICQSNISRIVNNLRWKNYEL